MKFGIPTENDKLCAHFGSCKLFTFVEFDESLKKIVSIETKLPEGHCHEYMVKWVTENNVNVIIAGGMGIPAQAMLKNQGINVIVGAPIETPEKLVIDFLNGNLKTGSTSCNCNCNH